MSCPSCTGGGGTQAPGKGQSTPGIVGTLQNSANLPTMETFQEQPYLWQNGPAVYPAASQYSFPRQPSNYWPGRVRGMIEFNCASGFVGCLDRETGHIQKTWVGLPGRVGRLSTVERDTSMDHQFTRKAQSQLWAPKPRNGKQAVMRSPNQVQPRGTWFWVY